MAIKIEKENYARMRRHFEIPLEWYDRRRAQPRADGASPIEGSTGYQGY
ncbi:MAG: hypothetical protein QM651_02120 [Rhodoblastus sp.]